MSQQPLRLVGPIARILQTTLLQRIHEVTRSFGSTDVDALTTLSFMDHVDHRMVCEAITTRAAAVHVRADIVVTSGDDLLFPLRYSRRVLNAVQHCPNTTPELEAAKASVERAVVTDLMRLSPDDVSSRDISSLWSCAIQHSQWEGVEALLRHFPIQQTFSMQDEREFTDLLQWMAFNTAASPPTGDAAAAPIPHVKRFLTEVLPLEDVVNRCRKAVLLQSAHAYPGARGDSAAAARESTDRETSALLCVFVASMLRKQCGLTRDFVLSEAEWTSCMPQSSGGASTTATASATPVTTSFGWWLRRLILIHDPAIPDYVRDTFNPIMTQQLQRQYRSRDISAAGHFFFRVLPAMCAANPGVDVRGLVRYYHHRAIDSLFWTVKSGAASASAASPTKRGRWTATPLPDVPGTDAAAAVGAAGGSGRAAATTTNFTAVSFFLPPEAALAMLLGEVSVAEEESAPLVAAHIPAITSMLRTVLDHLRKAFGPARSTGPPPPTLWRAWEPVQSAYFAVVLSGLLRAPADSPELKALVSEGLELLRRLLTMSVLEERASAVDMTTLLTCCIEAVQAIGGPAFEAQLRTLVVDNAMNGFSRSGLQRICEVATKRAVTEGPEAQERTRAFVAQLEPVREKLPIRNWA